MGRKILICEDDPAILHGVQDLLEDEGYEVIAARDGETGYRLAKEEDPDLVVLDVMLPKRSGVEVCRKLHEDRIRGAILMLTARATDSDKVRGFEAGADDYLTKPFGVQELLLRVKALLRRTTKLEDQLAAFTLGDLHIDFVRFEATRAGKTIELTPREFKILRLFCESPGRVITRNELLDKVWGYDVFPTTRTVDNHIVKLRKAIEPTPRKPLYIVSVRGVGYKLVTDPEVT
ncbi:MAG: response regulator transcription factor [Planctomycetota bacterium]|jgi:DNA-binding response OmpR family regulator